MRPAVPTLYSVAIFVHDIDRAVEFYRDTLGLPMTKHGYYCGLLHDRAVRFLAEPTQQSWGIMAMISDPDGNVLALWEDKMPEAHEHSPVDQADGTT